MVRKKIAAAWLLLAAMLQACGGGGGDAGTPVVGGGGGGASTVAALRLDLSSATIINTAPAAVTVTVTAVDANNQVVSDAPVVVTADSGGVVTSTASATDTSGVLTSSVGMGADTTVRTITVTATSGKITGAARISVVSTSGGTTVSALRVELSSVAIANQAPTPVTVTVTAVDSNNQVVSGAPVVVTADNGGVVTSTASSTSTSGTFISTVSMGADASTRTITVTATSGNVTGTAKISVVESVSGGAASLALALSAQTVTASNPVTVSVTLQDASGNAVPSAVVSFSTTLGLGTFSSSTALTDSTGKASVLLYPVSTTATGADYVVASATVSGTALTKSLGFQTSATSVGIQTFTSGLTGALSAYGQATLNVSLSGTTAGTPVGLSIQSLCANKGKATITPASVTTSSGSASFTYKDVQCGATDTTDTVTVTVVGTSTSGSLTIPLSQPSAGSLGFVSASPQTIYLKGSGLGETSVVTFVVNDQAGNPLPGQSVALQPTTTVGGLTMDALGVNTDGSAPTETKISDSNGQVAVRVSSGTVPTPVRIKATLTSAGISTVSSNLSIAVGLPSQLNFSLSQQTINIEGMNHDGTTNTYTVIASDRMGNPVPANTTVNFVAEGGQVQSQGFTTITNGLAGTTVNFQSADPRPVDGRITVVAYALGEESFIDMNGDNKWDSIEDYQDLGAVFLSRKFSQAYNAGQSDQFIKGAGTIACHSPSSSLLAVNASIPFQAGTCDGTWSNAGYVRRAAETVLSTSGSRLMWFRDATSTPVVANVSGGLLDDGCQAQSIVVADDGFTTSSATYYRMASGSLYKLPAAGSLTFLVSDENNNRLNPMPAGTTVTVSATDGITTSVSGGSPVANTSTATAAAISYKFTTASSGTIYISTTSPLGLTTTFPVAVSTSAAPPSGTACSL